MRLKNRFESFLEAQKSILEHKNRLLSHTTNNVELQDSYLSVVEALHHAALHNDRKINIHWIAAEDVETAGADQLLGSAHGIIVPGGFGKRGLEGMIATARYARSAGVPYLGLCLGMQIMVIEYARNELGISDATSLEIDPKAEIQVLPKQGELYLSLFSQLL